MELLIDKYIFIFIYKNNSIELEKNIETNIYKCIKTGIFDISFDSFSSISYKYNSDYIDTDIINHLNYMSQSLPPEP